MTRKTIVIAATVFFVCGTFLSLDFRSLADVQYVYDSQNRLVEVSYTGKVIRYTYDDAGNRTGMTVEILVAAPAIASLSPRGAVAGTGTFILKIFGSNFAADSVVNWNGIVRPTTFVSANELRLAIDPADVATVGSSSVVVVNPTPGVVASNSQTFSVVQTAALSGQVMAGINPLANVAIDLTGAETDSVVTDTNGNFNFAVLNNGSYTVTPTRVNYSFAPASRSVNYSGVSQTNLDFVGSLVSYSISGRIATTSSIGVAGVTVALSGSQAGQTTTDANGNYTINATAEGSYTITPTLQNHTFTPPNQTFANLSSAQIANFTAAQTLTLQDAPFDFDGDGKTDIGIFRPLAVAEWWINRSSTGQTFALQFGTSTDRIAPADYTGDGKADIAFFRPASGEWYVLRSEDFSFFALPFGTNGDIPAPADYDADGKADFAVFRPSIATWFISQSSGAPTRIFQFGANGDVPVVADYDGDARADVAIFRPAQGEWWIQRSTAGLLAMQFGASTDKPAQGDYTGDGKTDVAIWRPSTGDWYILRSEDFSFFGFPFGAAGDILAPGDYDGDGKADPTVFRPTQATWFIARSTAGTQIVQFGATGDRPIPNAFVP